ncbi:MAG: hypothetical protein AUJ71_04610 [Candidatus Omnitrophica bacterium CG1_02_49_16]|nr:MAG: hypothetical protein AUJ71_04610 [Candidatus Omnitrophica bacterium CG1_02_49_16]
MKKILSILFLFLMISPLGISPAVATTTINAAGNPNNQIADVVDDVNFADAGTMTMQGNFSIDTGALSATEVVTAAVTNTVSGDGIITYDASHMGSANIYGQVGIVGSNGPISTINLDGTGTLNLFGDTAVNSGVIMSDNSTLALIDGVDLTAAGGSAVSNDSAGVTGTLTVQGTSTITGTVGAAGIAALSAVNVTGGAGKTATFIDTVDAATVTSSAAGKSQFDGALTATDVAITSTGEVELNAASAVATTTFTGAGLLDINDTLTGDVHYGAGGSGTTTLLGGKNIVGGVDNTSGGAGVGTLTMEAGGSSNVSGLVGATNNLLAINTAAGAGETDTLTLATKAATVTSNNSDATGKTLFSGALTATNLAITNVGEVQLDTASAVGTTTFTGAGLLDLNADLTGAVVFAAGGSGTVALANGADISGTVTNTSGAALGTLTFEGDSTISSAIGTTGSATRLAVLNFNGGNVTMNSNIFADLSTIKDGATVTVSGDRTLEGDLTFAGTSTLDLGTSTMTINGVGVGVVTTVVGTTIKTTLNSATVFGNIAATGNATIIDGTTISVNVVGGLTSGAEIKIMNTAGGDINKNIIVVDNSTRYKFTGYNTTAGDITIVPTAVFSSAIATSPNNASVADVLESISETATGDMAAVQAALSGLSTDKALDAAYAQLYPAANAGANVSNFEQAIHSLGAVTDHLADLRNGVPVPGPESEAGVSTGDPWKDRGVWVKGFGSLAKQGIRSGVSGYKADMWGTAVGVDVPVNDETRVGLAGSYALTNVNNDGSSGGNNIDSYQGTLYASYDDPSPWYANGAFSVAWNKYNADRQISFGNINRTAKSNYNGQQYTGLFDVGYLWKYIENSRELDITPMASLTYSHLVVDRYTETEAGDLNLQVNSQNYDLLQSGLGIKIGFPFEDKSGTYVPDIHFKWLYDFIGDRFATSSTFTGGGGSFRTYGAPPAQSSFDLGAGVMFYTKGDISVSAAYDFELKEDYTSHTGQGVLRYSF